LKIHLLFFLILTIACNGQEKKMHKHTNLLIDETSPYLLQHAHNPVNWHPWNQQTLEKAKKEDKLLIISIGYSACHWCHVMEHESFENEEVAKVMNDRFINIKIDREERPDIDHIYMNAVQLMSQRGGWPLNCIALPDGRPVWGGTYFQKKQWINQINQVANYYVSNRSEMEEYAQKLASGIQQSELVAYNKKMVDFDSTDLKTIVQNWQKTFDYSEGGHKRSPKFPIPNNYEFLMTYGHLFNEQDIKEYTQITLDKIGYGGIYDHIGGGFSRYSTDEFWKVPHFEKMLYDNAQLISLYSCAYTAYKKDEYRQIVEETIAFIDRELSDESGAFYSALDADSEGEEGKFYIWKKEELKQIIGNEYPLFAKYFNVNNKGYWEHGNYILLKNQSDKQFCKQEKITINELKQKTKNWKEKLLQERNKRIRPGLDDKSLTSWNALMCKAYSDAYLAFGKKSYLEKALKNASFIEEKQWQENGALFHSYKKGKSTINGYLEDYAFTIEAFIKLYQATFDLNWLKKAQKLLEYCNTHFYDSQSGMYYFTSDLDPPLVARKMEIHDNVIPSSSSTMANNLFILSHFLDNDDYLQRAKVQLNNIKHNMESYGSGYSNWANLLMKFTNPFYQVAITGKDAHHEILNFSKHYIPNKILLGSKTESQMPLLKNKFEENKTLFYVCQNKSCLFHTSVSKQAAEYINSIK
jgi:uncharacterized protein YyaL (SSP411 family)